MKIKTIPTGPIRANCYVVYDEKTGDAAVIDPGSFDYYVQSATDGLNVKYIICTHGHFDHILGAGEIKDKTGAKLLIHRLDEECFKSSRANLIGDFYFDKEINLEADRLLEDGDEIAFGDIVLKVMHTPGHSKGSIILIDEKERVIFTGDTLFAGGTGRTDFYGSNPTDMRKSILKIMELDGEYHILPGHDTDTFLSEERKYYV
ncbi:MAG: MBL fold metallo-hydrolase [Clostridia bacterium]|nr:MBL fold metallo-hydrolase [Clostridia bacterium]